RALVEQVGLVELHAIRDLRDALEALGARAAHHAVHLVALLEQELREIGAVLTRDPGDERAGHDVPFSVWTCAGASSGSGSALRPITPRCQSSRTVSASTVTRKTAAVIPCRRVNETAIMQKADVSR